MKSQITRASRIAALASGLTLAHQAIADTPYASTEQAINKNISASTVTVETTTTGEFNGAVHASSGEYLVEATEGDITVINNDTETAGASGILSTGEGSRLTVTAAGDIYSSGRMGILANEGGILDITAANGGTVYATGLERDALYARQASSITVNGNLVAISQAAPGVLASNNSGITINGNLIAISQAASGFTANNNSTIHLKGSRNIIKGTYAVYADNSSTITIDGNTDITSGNRGIYATLGGSVTAYGHVSVNNSGTEADSYGICAGNNSRDDGTRSVINLHGGASISAANGKAIYASAGKITGHAATYAINGDIYAANNGEISLDMAGKSSLTGATYFRSPTSINDSTGIINLTLQGDSLWQVTGNSQLTSLTLGQGSAVQLAFDGTSLTDIISATDTITLEAGSVIYLTGDLSGLEGASFDFFSGDIVNNGVKFIGFNGNDWVEYEYTQTPGTNTFAFSANAPTVIEEPGFIPEPATATLGLLGLAALLARRRRA